MLLLYFKSIYFTNSRISLEVRVCERERNEPSPPHPTTGWLDRGSLEMHGPPHVMRSPPFPFLVSVPLLLSLGSNRIAPRRPLDSLFGNSPSYGTLYLVTYVLFQNWKTFILSVFFVVTGGWPCSPQETLRQQPRSLPLA